MAQNTTQIKDLKLLLGKLLEFGNWFYVPQHLATRLLCNTDDEVSPIELNELPSMQWWIYDMSLGIFAVAFRRGLLVNHNFSHQRSFGQKKPGIKQLVETTRLSRGCLEALYRPTRFALKVVQVSAATTRMMLLRAFSTRTKRVTPAQVHRLQSIPLSHTTFKP